MTPAFMLGRIVGFVIIIGVIAYGIYLAIKNYKKVEFYSLYRKKDEYGKL